MFQFTGSLITLATDEVEKMILFYSQLLGQEPVVYIPNVYAEFQLPGLRLGIFKPRELDRQEFQNQAKSGMSLCLEVNDLVSAIAHLTTLGYPPPGESVTMSHGKEIYVYDPGLNRLILHQTGRVNQC